MGQPSDESLLPGKQTNEGYFAVTSICVTTWVIMKANDWIDKKEALSLACSLATDRLSRQQQALTLSVSVTKRKFPWLNVSGARVLVSMAPNLAMSRELPS